MPSGENPALEPWDIKLLRALFLIRYADAVKATVDNLATLCLDRVDADKLALKRQIQESLARLERQNLVSRNGDLQCTMPGHCGGPLKAATPGCRL